MSETRTSAKQKARQLAKHLRGEHPDYAYLKVVFRHLRAELEVTIPDPGHRLPRVPTEEEIQRYYEAVWRARNTDPTWPARQSPAVNLSPIWRGRDRGSDEVSALVSDRAARR